VRLTQTVLRSRSTKFSGRKRSPQYFYLKSASRELICPHHRKTIGNAKRVNDQVSSIRVEEDQPEGKLRLLHRHFMERVGEGLNGRYRAAFPKAELEPAQSLGSTTTKKGGARRSMFYVPGHDDFRREKGFVVMTYTAVKKDTGRRVEKRMPRAARQCAGYWRPSA